MLGYGTIGGTNSTPRKHKSWLRARDLFKRKDLGVFIGGSVLIVAPCVLFSIYVIPYLLSQGWGIAVFVFAWLLALTLSSMFVTSITDPGFLPHDLHPDLFYHDVLPPDAHPAALNASANYIPPPPLSSVGRSESLEDAARHFLESSNPLAHAMGSEGPSNATSNTSLLPQGYPFIPAVGTSASPARTLRQARPMLSLTRDITVNGVPMKIKYCETCNIWRPPRTSHCSACGHCVEVHDHHCPWMANCIGKRNYRFFFAFLVSCLLLDIYVFAWSVAYIVILIRSGPRQFRDFFDVLAHHPVVLLLILFTFLMMFSLLGMVAYHSWITSENLTTHEQLRSQVYYETMNGRRTGRRIRHPFHKGSAMENIKWVLCRPIEISYLYWDYAPIPTEIREHDADDVEEGISVEPNSSHVIDIAPQRASGEGVHAGSQHLVAPQEGEVTPLRSSCELQTPPLSPPSMPSSNRTGAAQSDAPVQQAIPSPAPSHSSHSRH
ncbi:DHHC palmitoyltransferase-domain-containing protein [Cladochytrium replicatum]|nr:DHHC palmitoyltransferase-domain-containing protein [Cladochytrium replicatum]